MTILTFPRSFASAAKSTRGSGHQPVADHLELRLPRLALVLPDQRVVAIAPQQRGQRKTNVPTANDPGFALMG